MPDTDAREVAQLAGAENPKPRYAVAIVRWLHADANRLVPPACTWPPSSGNGRNMEALVHSASN